MLSSELFDLGDAITLPHHLGRACDPSSPCRLDRSAVVVFGPPLPLFLDQCFLPGQARHTERKEVSMARLMSIAAAVALMLSAAFAAGLTCGG